jgi:hypothetical protein
VSEALRAAAFDDPRFEPERLRAAVEEILAPLARAERARELHALLLPMLRVERYLGWSWLPIANVPPFVRVSLDVEEWDVVTVRNRGAGEPAEAVVRVAIRLRTWLLTRPHTLWLSLADPDGSGWRLTRTDVDREGEFHLAAEEVREPSADPAMRDEAVHELAAADAVETAELRLDTDGDAGRHMLDLSLVDGRFAPAVVEASVREIMRAWREAAVSGDSAALEALSTPEIPAYARDADVPTRLRSVRVLVLEPPPHPALYLSICAVTQHAHGAREKESVWKLALDDDLPQHWRLVDPYARSELRRAGIVED